LSDRQIFESWRVFRALALSCFLKFRFGAKSLVCDDVAAIDWPERVILTS
jgi:hypothetical protein